ncbi:MAG: hypothetical protein EOP45_11600, partial [Sphingobacteriaceae bacterium]
MNPDADPFEIVQLLSPINSNYLSTQMKMYVANVRGLRTKSKELYADSSTHLIDIYALSETSLCNGISSSEYFDANYNVFRKDRYEGTSSTSRGGGVLIAINSRFICETVPLLDTSNIDCVCVKIVLNRSTNLFIHNAYIPPNSSPDLYAAHLNAINKLHSLSAESDIILVVGDFNIPKVEWEHDIDEFGDESNVMLPNCAHLEPSFNHNAEFIFDINELGMYQINDIWREDHKNL